MPEVDPEDDTIWRWVIHHYRYDPGRRERRHVVVAAYDNANEFEAELERYQQQVQAVADGRGREQVSGTTRHPGYRAEHELARIALRAIQHGVSARRLLAKGGRLPSNVGVYGADESGRTYSFGGGEPPQPPTD